jgi:CIC family chloride channel protein
MFNTEQYDVVSVKELMRKPPAVLQHTDSMDGVMKTFDATGAWNLPVTQKGRYLGFISKSAIFSRYRNELIEKSVH